MAQSNDDEKNPKKIYTIDEALAKTHFGAFNYRVIIFSGFVLNNVVLESVGISFALPVLKCDLDLTSEQQGILGAVAFIGIIVSSHLWGFLADTLGRRYIMRPALMIGFIITIFSSLAPNFEILAVLRFLNGVLLSAGSATIFAYVGEFHCPKNRNRAILSAALMSASLAFFFPLIAWLFINQQWNFQIPLLDVIYKPWRLYILACGASGFVLGLCLYVLPESPKYLLTVGRIDDALKILKYIHQVNTKNDTEFQVNGLIADLDTPIKVQIPTSSLSTANKKNNIVANLFYSMWQQTAPLFGHLHIRKTLLSSLIQFVIFFTAHGVYMWFPYILNNAMQYYAHYTNQMCLCDIIKFIKYANSSSIETQLEVCVTHLEISTYKHTVILEVIYITLLLCICYSITKFGRIPMLFIILLICGVCGILGTVLVWPMIAIYSIIIMLCCGLGTTVVNAIVVDIYPTNLRAMAVCISLMLGRIGSVTGSAILGALIETNCFAALLCASAALIIAGILGFFLPKSNTDINMKKQIQPQLNI